MEKKVNIAELLKACPKGMELYSPIFGTVYFEGVKDTGIAILIKVTTSRNSIHHFYPDGKYNIYYSDSECLLFPSKDQRDWSKFQRPFKDGDVVAYSYNDKDVYIFIFKEYIKGNYAMCHMMMGPDGIIDFSEGAYYITRFATGEEKLKLFNALKDNGYKWDNEKMSLEKSNPFYTGEVLVSSMGNIVLLSHVDDKEIIYYHCILEPLGNFRICEIPNCGVGKTSNCILASKEQRDRLFDKLKKSGYKYNSQTNKLEKLPSFKVGNRIRSKISNIEYTITDIRNDVYIIHNDDDKFGYHVSFDLECNYELVPDKFDITTLKTFDRVLVRCSDNGYWQPQFFSKFNSKSNFPFQCTYNSWSQCIPYEGNEHLSDTTNDCDEFYKNW